MKSYHSNTIIISRAAHNSSKLAAKPFVGLASSRLLEHTIDLVLIIELHYGLGWEGERKFVCVCVRVCVRERARVSNGSRVI
jgi:hypothetical protein